MSVLARKLKYQVPKILARSGKVAAVYKQRRIVFFLDMGPKDQTRYIQSFPSIVTLGRVIKLMINTGKVYRGQDHRELSACQNSK